MIDACKIPVASMSEYHDALRYLHDLGHMWASGASLIGPRNWYDDAFGLRIWYDGAVTFFTSIDMYKSCSAKELQLEELAAMGGHNSTFDEDAFLSLLS